MRRIAKARSGSISAQKARRRGHLALVLVAMLVLSAAIGANLALAAPKGVTTYFGDLGAAGGQLNNPRGVAVRQSNGDVYVVDAANSRVQQFTAGGTFVRAWGWDVNATTPGTGFEVCPASDTCKVGISGGGAGQLIGAAGIAIDQSDGSVYVSEASGLRVQKFSASGAFVAVFGKDVNATSPGTGVEVCTAVSGNTCKAGASGSAGGEFLTFALISSFQGHVAVAPAGAPNAGNVLVADPGNKRVQEFTSAGAFVRTFGFDVVATGVSAEDTGTGFEVCTQAVTGAAGCQLGTAGSGVGQFGAEALARVAVDSTGAIYTVESNANFRVQKFTPEAGPPPLSPAVFAAGILSGAGSSSTPTDVAIGTANNVLVVKANASPAERRVLELDSTGALLDTHAAGEGIAVVNGLAVNTSSGNLYLSSTTGGTRVYVLNAGAAPVLALGAVSDLEANGATLNGTVNPSGSLTTYRFEFKRTADVTWIKVPSTDLSAGSGSSAVSVSQPVGGPAGLLEPGTSYDFRLVADGWGEPMTIAPSSFVTPAGKPILLTTGAAVTNKTTATLRGRVIPNNGATAYRFEYGPASCSSNPCVSAPAVEGSAGTGMAAADVSEQIGDLEPGTTYHYRFVATNGTGSAASGDRTFTTDPSAAITAEHRPEGRVYEQVSPQDKNGAGAYYSIVAGNHGGGYAAPSGNAYFFMAEGAFADAPSYARGIYPNTYIARREGGRWTTVSPELPLFHDPGFIWAPSSPLGFSHDLSRAFYSDPNGNAPPSADGQPSVWDAVSKDMATGVVTRMSGDILPAPAQLTIRIAGVSGGRVLIQDQRPLLSSDPLPTGTAFNSKRLYSWDGDGLTLLSPPGVAVQNGSGLTSPGLDGLNPVSSGTGRVFFETGASAARHVTLAEIDSGALTQVDISTRTLFGGVPAGSSCANSLFQAAARDGSVAYFACTGQLTDDATPNGGLYRYDVAGGQLSFVTPTAPGVTTGAGISRAWGISDDGEVLYVTATGALAPGAPSAGRKLYVIDHGEVRYITTLGSTDGSNVYGNGAQASASGSRFFFFSTADQSAVTGVDVRDAVTSAIRPQAYVYDNASRTVGCVSCPPERRPVSEVGFGTPGWTFGLEQSVTPMRWVTADGARAFFRTKEALVPGDSNGQHDIYEWLDGQVYLVSTGSSKEGVNFGSVTPSGSDVFFSTTEVLSWTDVDSLYDVYTARVGGGIPRPPSTGCAGEDCQGLPASSPVAGNPASSTFSGTGNLAGSRAASCNRNQVRRGNRCVAKRAFAKRACAKRKGKAKQRCVAGQMRRLNRVQQRQLKAQQRQANTDRRAGR